MHEIHFVCSFFSAARRTNQEAPPRLSVFWLVATVAVGVCGTRFARTVLALFPPSSLRLRRPIKAESGGFACILTSLFINLFFLLTPSPFGHSPYIPCRKHPVRLRGTAGGECDTLVLLLSQFFYPLCLLTPPSLRTPPLYFALQNAGEEGESNPPLIAV